MDQLDALFGECVDWIGAERHGQGVAELGSVANVEKRLGAHGTVFDESENKLGTVRKPDVGTFLVDSPSIAGIAGLNQECYEGCCDSRGNVNRESSKGHDEMVYLVGGLMRQKKFDRFIQNMLVI